MADQNGEISEKITTPVLTKADKLQQGNLLKDEGNAFYQQKDYKNAIKKYHWALLHVKGLVDQPFQEMIGQGDTEEFKQRVRLAESSCYNNLAAIHLAECRWSKVVDYCSKVLDFQPNNSKALYRRGLAFMNLKDIDRAQEDLTKASSLEPTDNRIKRTLATINKEYKKTTEEGKKRYAAMFENMFI